MRPNYSLCVLLLLCLFVLCVGCRYIKDTNIKNSAEDLNALINKLAPAIKTWTPQPGAVLDLGLALRDPTSRLEQLTCLSVFSILCHCGKERDSYSICVIQLHKPQTLKQ